MDFNNTEIEYARKSKADLKKSYTLIKIIAWNWLIKIGPTMLKIFMPLYFPIPIIRATMFKHVCGGESIEETVSTTQELAKLNVKTILDYYVEGEQLDSVFDANILETLTSIEKASMNKNIPFAVFKPTGFGRFELLEKVNAKKQLTVQEKDEFERFKNRVDTLCQAAFNANVPVFIDAEETWIQNPVDELALEMMRKYNKEKAIVYNTAQL